MDSDADRDQGAVNQRLDRLFLTLVSGLFLIVATFITGTFFG